MDDTVGARAAFDKQLTTRYDGLVRRHYRAVYGLLCHLTGDPAVAEDLCQETYLAAWRGLPEFRGECSPATWLRRIALNEYRQYLRRSRPLAPAADEPVDEAPGPVEQIVRRELREAVRRQLDRLPPAYREVLVLRYVIGHGVGATATLLDLPPGTVKWRAHKGLRLLRERLEVK